LTEKSKRFYGTLSLANGKRKQQPLTEDKTSSVTLLRRLQTQEDNKRASGVTEDVERRQKPITGFVDAYGSYLASKDGTPMHITNTLYRIRSLLTATKTNTIDDLNTNRILKTLSEWRTRKRKPISVGTSNHYLIAVKAFSRWLYTERMSSDDPLRGLRRMNAETDRKRVRRPLTDTEFKTLTGVTQQSRKTYRGDDWQFTCTDRVALYTIAAYTGLRAKELSALTKSSFNFDNMTWTLPAIATKNRKAVTLPLHPTLSTFLRSWFATLKRETLFPGSWVKGGFGGRLLKRDLKRAGVAYVVDGKYADFHALRHTFITNLAKAKVHPAKAQRLARHSTIALTMDVYTSLDVDDLRDDLGRLT
jgi:integrase